MQLNLLRKKKYFDRLKYNEESREFYLKEISIENFFYSLTKISSNLSFLNANSSILKEKLIDIFKKNKNAKIFSYNSRTIRQTNYANHIYDLILKLSRKNIFLCLAYGGYAIAGNDK